MLLYVELAAAAAAEAALLPVEVRLARFSLVHLRGWAEHQRWKLRKLAIRLQNRRRDVTVPRNHAVAVHREPPLLPVAFWNYPDWSGGYNLYDAGAQPFWMLPPLLPNQEVAEETTGDEMVEQLSQFEEDFVAKPTRRTSWDQLACNYLYAHDMCAKENWPSVRCKPAGLNLLGMVRLITYRNGGKNRATNSVLLREETLLKYSDLSQVLRGRGPAEDLLKEIRDRQYSAETVVWESPQGGLSVLKTRRMKK